ncbi:MAG: flagellar export chaperone FliS [Alphaproteobacteria bacterium]
MKQHYQAYVQATHTVAKTKQIVMLYDGVIRFIQQAKEAIRERRIEDRYRLLLKASEVIYGLQGALDFESGGHIAKVLYNYYSNMDMKIFTIHRTNSMEECDVVIAELKQMRDVWAEIDEQMAGDSAAPQSAPAAEVVASSPSGNTGEPPQGITLSA